MSHKSSIRKKILIVCSTGDYYGGAIRSTIATLKILSGKYTCYVLIPHPTDEVMERLRGLATVLPMRIPWWITDASNTRPAVRRALINTKKALSLIWREVTMLWILKRLNIDCTYICDGVICTGSLSSKILNIPYIIHLREFNEEDHGQRYISKKLAKVVLSNAANVLCVSLAIQKKFCSLYPMQSTVVYNPISIPPDSLARTLTSTRPLEFIIVGAISPWKGQLEALKFFSLLRNKGFNAHLTIVGASTVDTGNYEARLHEFVKINTLEDKVRFTGQIPDASEYYARSDFALIFSNCEAFGRVTVEAAAWGCIPIGKMTGGTTELINLLGGIPYTLESSPTTISAVEEYVRNPEILKKTAARIGSIAEKSFSPEVYKSTILPIFAALMPEN